MKFKDLEINFFSYLFHWDLTIFFICYYLSISFSKQTKKICPCTHTQLCLTLWLCNPIDCSLPGSSVYGIFQARIRECVAISYSRGLLNPRIETQSLGSPVLAGRFFTTALPGNHWLKDYIEKKHFPIPQKVSPKWNQDTPLKLESSKTPLLNTYLQIPNLLRVSKLQCLQGTKQPLLL